MTIDFPDHIAGSWTNSTPADDDHADEHNAVASHLEGLRDSLGGAALDTYLGAGTLATRLTALAAAVTASVARVNHTGVQPIATVTGLQEALDGKETAGAAATGDAALLNGAPAGGDTLLELHNRLAILEALGSLATDAELLAAITALLAGVGADGDTLFELRALLNTRLVAASNLGDVPNPNTARTNLGVHANVLPVDAIAGLAGATAQAILEELAVLADADRVFDDIAVAFQLREDFAGGGLVVAGGRAGQNGWNITPEASGAGVAYTQTAGTGTTSMGTLNITLTNVAVAAAGFGNLNLHVQMFEGSPVFRFSWRVSLSALNGGGNEVAFYIGAHSGVTSAEPLHGFYFRYSTASANWEFVCAANGSRTAIDTGVLVVVATQVVLEARSTGTGSVQAYIDGVAVGAPITTNLPAGTGQRWGLSSTIAKTLGAGGTFILRHDWCVARVELDR